MNPPPAVSVPPMPSYGLIDRFAASVTGLGKGLLLADVTLGLPAPAVLRSVEQTLPNAPFHMILTGAQPGLRQGGAILQFEIPGFLVGGGLIKSAVAGTFPRSLLRIQNAGVEQIALILDPVDAGTRVTLRGWREPGSATVRCLLLMFLMSVIAFVLGLLTLTVALLVVNLLGVHHFPFELSRIAGVSIAAGLCFAFFLVLMRIGGVATNRLALRSLRRIAQTIEAAAVTNHAFSPASPAASTAIH